MCLEEGKDYTAVLDTSEGLIEIDLNVGEAPLTVNNFVWLARYHFYDGLTFHRVVPGFVIQGGDPVGTGLGGPGYQFADELPSTKGYPIGALAMASSGAITNGSQFFIVSGDLGMSIPPVYSSFGIVTAGRATVDKINSLGTGDGTPMRAVTILSVTIKTRDVLGSLFTADSTD